MMPYFLSGRNEIFKKVINSKKSTNTWRLNNMLLNHKWIIEEIRGKIKIFLKSKENENTTYQNL
jgi:hypothetical protein